MKVLVVDDQVECITLVHDLVENGHQVVVVQDGAEAVQRLSKEHFDVVVTDLRVPRIDGMELLTHVKRHLPQTEVVIMTASASIPLVVEAMKRGALDFLSKPVGNGKLVELVNQIGQGRPKARGPTRIAQRPEAASLESIIVGRSQVVQSVRSMVDLCSRNDVTLLLIGATGTGKDLVARTIHDLSSRRAGPFVKVNCSTFPQHLMESALFGHAKGSFTGADQQRSGKFDLARGGTLYLDDVDDIPLEHQIKLLRVIEEKVYERVGSPNPIEADVRLIASTKQNLLEKTEKGAFRSDLYYRLNVLRIELPTLRERMEDLPELTRHLLKRISHGQEYRISEGAMDMLFYHTWPGNVRELANALERAYITENGLITSIVEFPLKQGTETPAAEGHFDEAIRQAERELLQRSLDRAKGNKTEAARMLGLKLSTFRDKLIKHGLA